MEKSPITRKDVAERAIHAIYQTGLAAPHDMSVVGYDDILNAAYLNPHLTPIKLPIAEMGHAAGKKTLDLIKNGNSFPQDTTTLPVELIVPASTAPPRAAGS